MRKLSVLLCAAAMLAAPAPVSFALAAGERYVDVIVSLKGAPNPSEHAMNLGRASEVAQAHGLTARFTYGTALVGFAARVPEARLGELRQDPRVQSVTIDAPMHAFAGKPGASAKPGGGTPPPQTVPWGIARIGADANTNEGDGINVFVIDTGIDSDHPDLAANIGAGHAVVSCRGRTCLQPWDDDNGHGTHVSGTIGAIDNTIGVIGVASRVTLHAVKVLSNSGSGSTSGVIAGVDWVAQQAVALGVPVVANMSLGGAGSKTGTCTSAGFVGSDTFHQAMCNAKNDGVVFAVAAGNDGADAQNSTPAAYDDAVVTVSATNISDDWASFSNWGDNTATWTTHASAPVAIAAPGVSVLSTWNDGGTNTISGTSMATPHVAGSLALYLKTHPQPASGAAFDNARAGLLAAAECGCNLSNTTGHPHAEDFLNARGL